MSRNVHEISDDLATAQMYVETAELEYAALTRSRTDAGARLSDMTVLRDRLRLELRAALREAGEWPDHGEDAPRPDRSPQSWTDGDADAPVDWRGR